MRRRDSYLVQGLAVAGLAVSVALSGCTLRPTETPPEPHTTITIGTLQTDDLLPLWVAVEDGTAYSAGLDLKITTFASAQEQTAAVTAKQVDAIMTDMVVPVLLTEGGTPMRAVTILQTSPAGIVAAPGSGITTVSQLAGVPTGSATGTIMAYTLDRALADAGVPAGQRATEEIKNLSVRLQMLMGGNIKAAVLPWTLYALATAQGAVPLVGVDQAGAYSSTVLAFRDEWLTSHNDAARVMARLYSVWDDAVAKINAAPDTYRGLLAAQGYIGGTIPYTALVWTTQ